MNDDHIRTHPLYADWRDRVLAAMLDPNMTQSKVRSILDEKPLVLAAIEHMLLAGKEAENDQIHP